MKQLMTIGVFEKEVMHLTFLLLVCWDHHQVKTNCSL